MKANPRILWNELRRLDWSEIAIAGLLGNFQQESNFETEVLGFDGTGSYGLAQWLGPRKRALFAYSRERGRPPEDPLNQLQFVDKELRTTESRAGGALRAAHSVEHAALVVSKYYERPHPKYAHNDKRVKYALEIYKRYTENG